jgi:hypothetical protein
MRDFGVKVAAVHNDDVPDITRSIRSEPGVVTVEVDVSSGWIFAHGHGLDEAALLTRVRTAGLVPVCVQHDTPPDPGADIGPGPGMDE